MTDYLSIASRQLVSSDRDRWKAAILCAVEPDIIKPLADLRGCTVYTIYNLSYAGHAWLKLCPHMKVADRDKFRLDVFVEANHALNAGKDPEEVARFFLDVLAEHHNPNMEEVKGWLRGTFHLPVHEARPSTHLKAFDRAMSWAEQKLFEEDRTLWNGAAKVIRSLLKKYAGIS
jgi:hypothetical protein